MIEAIPSQPSSVFICRGGGAAVFDGTAHGIALDGRDIATEIANHLFNLRNNPALARGFQGIDTLRRTLDQELAGDGRRAAHRASKVVPDVAKTAAIQSLCRKIAPACRPPDSPRRPTHRAAGRGSHPTGAKLRHRLRASGERAARLDFTASAAPRDEMRQAPCGRTSQITPTGQGW